MGRQTVRSENSPVLIVLHQITFKEWGGQQGKESYSVDCKMWESRISYSPGCSLMMTRMEMIESLCRTSFWRRESRPGAPLCRRRLEPTTRASDWSPTTHRREGWVSWCYGLHVHTDWRTHDFTFIGFFYFTLRGSTALTNIKDLNMIFSQAHENKDVKELLYGQTGNLMSR